MGRSKRSDPRQSRERAWEIVVNPREYSKISRRQLINRGLQPYETDTSIDEDALLRDVSQFIIDALERPPANKIINNRTAFADKPGQLALVFGLGSLLVRRHDLIESNSREPRIHEYIRELYFNNIYSAANHSGDRNVIRRAMGELAYGRDKEDEYGPPVGNVIEGVTRLDIDNRVYYKIPLVHANRQCEARDSDGNLDVVVHQQYVYVPVDDVKDKYERYFGKQGNVARHIEDVVDKTVSDDRLDEYLSVMKSVRDRIEELDRLGKDHLLYQDRKYPSELKVILMAVDNADPEVAKLGTRLTAADIADAVDTFVDETELDWVASVGKGMRTVNQVSPKLSKFANDSEHPHVTVEEQEGGDPNEYVLEYAPSDFKVIEVTEIGDLLEFPCFKSLHESLLKGKPQRWELYSFVRYMLEINSVDFTNEEIHDWFNQYPWYRKDVTDYQLDYEKRQTIGDDRPLPISCNNDNRNWSSHCIGMENCEYSLYQSVELDPDVYQRLG